MKKRIVLIFFIFLFVLAGKGQSFDPEITKGKLTIESDIFPGYKSFLDFNHEAVQKGWWRFSRKFGKPVNMRKYYETTIVNDHEENVHEVVLISKSLKYGRGTVFYLTLKNTGLSSELEKKYLKQVQTLLFEFKQEFYLSFYEDEMKDLERQAAQATKSLDKSRGNPQMEKQSFQELEKVNAALDEVKDKVRKLQQ